MKICHKIQMALQNNKKWMNYPIIVLGQLAIH